MIWAKAGNQGGSPGPASLELLWPWLAAKAQIEHHVSNRDALLAVAPGWDACAARASTRVAVSRTSTGAGQGRAPALTRLRDCRLHLERSLPAASGLSRVSLAYLLNRLGRVTFFRRLIWHNLKIAYFVLSIFQFYCFFFEF